jgi:hypothetical protein
LVTAGAGTGDGSTSGDGGEVRIAAGGSANSTGGTVVIEAGESFTSGVENGNITLGVEHASVVDIGRHSDDARILLNGLVEAYTFKIGRQDYSGVKNKHLKFDTEAFTVPDMYPSSVYTFDVYAPGAALGDITQASFSKSLGNMFLTSQVNEADKVRVSVHNPGYSADVQTLPEGTFIVTCTSYAESPYVSRFAVPVSSS